MAADVLIPAIIGVVFGGGTTLLVSYLQSRNNLNRDYIKIAHELALEEYKTHFEVIKSRGGKMQPLEANMAYYTLFIKLLKRKDFDLAKLKNFRNVQKELNEIYADKNQAKS